MVTKTATVSDNLEKILDFYTSTEKLILRDPFRSMNKYRVAKMVEANELYTVRHGGVIHGCFRVWVPSVQTRVCGISGKVFNAYPAGKAVHVRNVAIADESVKEFMVALAHLKKEYPAVVVECNMADQLLVETLEQSKFIRRTSKVTAFADIIGVYICGNANYKALRITTLENVSENATIFDIGIKIPKTFVDSIAAKLKSSQLDFAQHYSNYNEKDAWSAVCLRSYGGDVDFVIKPSVMTNKWKKDNQDKLDYEVTETSLMYDFPEVRNIMDCIPGEKDRVRFMNLSPGGGTLGRHTDKADSEIGIEVGNIARLHVPIVTNPKVEFTLWDLEGSPKKQRMDKGKLWYLDIRKPHMAINGGKHNRVHLVIDTFVTTELRNILKDSFRK